MVDGLNNLSGDRTVTIELEGKQWTLSTAVLADHAEKESYIHSLRPQIGDLLKQIPAGLPAAQMKSLHDTILKNSMKPAFVTQEEENEFDISLHGVAWRLWRAMRDHHAEFGMMSGDAEVAYQAPNGKKYSVTPADGVQALIDFMERIGNEKLTELQNVADRAEEKDLLPN